MTAPAPILRFVGPGPGAPCALLEDLNRRIAGRPGLDEVMAFLFDALRQVTPCDRLGLAFTDEEDRRIVARWARATYEPLLLDRAYAEDLGAGSLGSVLRQGSTRIIEDLEAYGREHPRSASTRLLLREGVRSSLTCPLAVEDRRVGVVFLSSRQPRAFTDAHVALWQGVAERLGQAVEKAWRIERLEAANQAYLEVLAFVSHELKNPVASMMTDARLLADGYLGDLAPAQRDKLERLAAKGRHVLDLVRGYLDLARVDGGDLRLSPRPVDLVAEVLEPALDLVLPQIQARGQHLERAYAGPLAPVVADPELLKIVAINLLGNATKYGAEGGRLRLSLERTDGDLRLVVWNEGPGFRPEDHPRLFRRFSRLEAPGGAGRRPGTGIGLYTCRRIAQLHGGRMEAASEPGAWAEFALVLPARRDEGHPPSALPGHPS